MTKLLAQTPAIQIAMNKNKLAIVDPRLRLRTEFHFDRFIVCLLKSENAKFTIFPTSSFCGGYTQHCKDKVERKQKTTSFQLYKSAKKVSIFQRLDGKNVRTNFIIQKHDGQKINKKHTKNSPFFALQRRAKSEINQTWHNGVPCPHPCINGDEIWRGGVHLWSTPPCRISSPSVPHFAPVRRKTSKSPRSN